MAPFFSCSLFITSLTFLCFLNPSLSTHPDTPSLLSIASSLSFSLYPSLYSWVPFPLSTPCSSSCYGITCNSTSSALRVSGLYLHSLSLEGRFPIAITRLSELRTLDIHGNRLFGPIPRELAKLKHLVELNLADNLFSANIPAEIFGMARLQVLDLHANRLSGGICTSLAQFSQLRYFNVCSNDMFLLEGPILKGQCSMWKISTQIAAHIHYSNIAETPMVSHVAESDQNYSPSSWYQKLVNKVSLKIAYRSRMLEESASNSTNTSSPHGKQNSSAYHDVLAPAMAPSAYEHTHKKPKALRWLLGILIGMGLGVFSAGLCSFAFRLISKYRNRVKPAAPVVFQRKFVNAKDLAFLLMDSSLEGLEVLGHGGSGQVYKAVLDTGKTVAIKRVLVLMRDPSHGIDKDPSHGIDKKLLASYDLTQNSRQICAELKTLAQVRHRNLVSLLAYIPTPNSHLLVYDYMENGSLHDALRRAAHGTLDFTWPMRYNIALGVAMGLKYLHFDSSPRVIHRDLKPANILLDAKMEAHIGDFGIAKVMPEVFTHFSTTNVAGTVGYIAPEFNQTLRYTEKGDVYSYGVVLAVLLTGKEPTDEFFGELASSMSNWVMEVMEGGEGRVLACLEPKLLGHGFDGEMILAFKLAAFCVQQNPISRPSSAQVVQILTSISSSLPKPSLSQTPTI